MEYISGARSTRRPDGVIVVDGREVADTKQCVHCGCHFVMVKGSGKVRGWCPTCLGITCGRRECDPCLPFEKRLDLYEKGKLPKL